VTLPEAIEDEFHQRPETAVGRAMYDMLLAVHAHIRRDLEIVQGLAAQAVDGVSGTQLREQLHELKRGSILWRLQVDCLRHCRFVHLHHHLEDTEFFPELREANPALTPVIDRLEADHRRVSDDLDAIEAAARALAEEQVAEAREALVHALGALERHLLEHLDYEELNVATTVRRLR
jgi:hemerythrin-like domain-containing protein